MPGGFFTAKLQKLKSELVNFHLLEKYSIPVFQSKQPTRTVLRGLSGGKVAVAVLVGLVIQWGFRGDFETIVVIVVNPS
jgi:hypothetical protein